MDSCVHYNARRFRLFNDECRIRDRTAKSSSDMVYLFELLWYYRGCNHWIILVFQCPEEAKSERTQWLEGMPFRTVREDYVLPFTYFN